MRKGEIVANFKLLSQQMHGDKPLKPSVRIFGVRPSCKYKPEAIKLEPA
jgi:hypothetical protein